MIHFRITENKTSSFFELLTEAVNEEGRVLSKGSFSFVHSQFTNNTLKTLLAGGIATPVENRRGGNIRGMFDYMHRYAAEAEAAVALLHPFSFSYYRKFGYERVADHLILRIPTRMIDCVPRRCKFVPYEPSMLPDLQNIYQRFASGRNLLLSRTNDNRFTKEKRFTYVYYQRGIPSAYIVYSASKELCVNHYENTLLTVREMAYTSPDALREIFSFLRMFEGEYDWIEFGDVTLYPEVDMLLGHHTHTSYRIVPDLMARVLNTEKMLMSNAYPQREGSFTVRVEDALPTVSGSFRVDFGGGECRVKRLEPSSNVDLILTVGAFTQLIYGYRHFNAETARYMDGVELLNNSEDFFRAFPQRPCGIFEHF